jgi:integrase
LRGEHERALCDQHLAAFKGRRVQKVTASEVAGVLRSMRDDGLSEWTCSAVYRIGKGVFVLAVRRGILTRSPADGLTPAERPKQRNARNVERLDSATIRLLIAAAPTERWKAGLALAGLGGFASERSRGVKWGDVDLQANTISVSRSLLPDGTPKPPKTDSGVRVVPLFAELRQLLLTWKIKSPFTDREDYVLVTLLEARCSSGTRSGRSRRRKRRRGSIRSKAASHGTASDTRPGRSGSPSTASP